MVSFPRIGKYLWLGWFLAGTVLSLTACGPMGPTPYCTTYAGVNIIGYQGDGSWPDPTKWTCELFQSDESDVLSVLGDEHYANFDKTRLWGYSVYIRFDDPNWVDWWGRDIAGQTTCATKTIIIGDSFNPIISSFPHELIHALQDCNPPQPQDPGDDADHADWNRHHAWDAIDLAKSR